MPYIKPGIREGLDPLLYSVQAEAKIWKGPEGILNYCVTRLVRMFLGDAPDYARFNAAIGVLECAKLELHRRMVAPYEDTKIAENGDVF